MKEYTYEDVKAAYQAVIAVGKAKVTGLFGSLSAQMQHNKNLKELQGPAKELYEKLMSDESIHY